jgi:uncharacterized OsmC-like protein
MSDMEKIKTAFERGARALTLRPSLGRSTGRSVTRVRDGLTCEIEEGPWRLVADMPEQLGGAASGPTPGVYGRAALGSCLAVGYVMRAAAMGIPIRSLEVEVQADYDDGVLLGVAEGPAGYSEVRYLVTVETDAPEEDVVRWLDEADAHSPYLDVFRRAQRCARQVAIVAPAKP